MFSNFTEETCTGTGSFLSFTGATVGNIPFSASFSDGDPIAYVLEDSAGIIKIAGIGIYSSSLNRITRTDTWNWNGSIVDKNPPTAITLSSGVHTIRSGAIDKSLTNGFQRLTPNGHYFTPFNLTYSSAGGAPGGEFTSSSGRLTLSTIGFNRAVKISSIGTYITTSGAAGALSRLGIYGMDPDGIPLTLLADSGDLISTSTGAVFGALASSIILPAGDYYAADIANNVTMRSQGFRSANAGTLQGSRQGTRIDTGPFVGEHKNFYDIGFSPLPNTLPARSGVHAWASLGIILQ